MLRPFLVIALMALSVIPVRARSAISTEDRWNPQHIEILPAEIRQVIAAHARACGGALAADHSFVRYFQRGTVKFIGLHFEHLRCGDRRAVCTAAGCLHEVYVSTGGRYRLMRSSHVRELDLTDVNMPASRGR